MASIGQYIANIRSAAYGREVRESIASAIEQCYDDATTADPGNTNLEVIAARGTYNTLKDRENAQDAAIDASVALEATSRQAADAALGTRIDAEKQERREEDGEILASLNSEKTARQSADNNLQSQIDELVAPTGEAPSAAEVTNARVGADGVTYPSLGDAIRTQFTNVNGALATGLAFRDRDTSITTSNQLIANGIYNINTSWYTDLQTAFGSNYGSLITFGNSSIQHYQMLYFETGELHFRWIKANGTTGVWHKIWSDSNLSLDNVLMYKVPEARDNVDSSVLQQVGMYFINTNWYTDLPGIMGANKVVMILSLGRANSQVRAQYATTESGDIFMRRITSNGTIRDWVKLYAGMTEGHYIAFGDSRTYGVIGGATGQSEYRYPKYIANAMNMSYGNHAVSGSGLFARDSIGTAAAIDKIQATDISGASLITIEYGVNDWEHPLGVYTDTGSTTWCGRLYQVIKYINETNPLATLVVIGSLNTLEGNQATSYGYGYTTQSGWSLGALINEEAKLCAKYHVPFISGYDSPITDFNIASLIGDTYHLTEPGHKIRSRYLLGQVRNFYTAPQR